MMKRQKLVIPGLLLLVCLLTPALGGCAPAAEEATVAPRSAAPASPGRALSTVPPKPAVTEIAEAPAVTAVAPATIPAATLLPSPTTLPPMTTPAETDVSYAVAYVLPADSLNVRAAPGPDQALVATLEPGTQDIRVTGAGQEVADSLWVPVQQGDMTGWVNSHFLTGAVADDAFCADPQVEALLAALETAVAARDGEALAALVHPERGLRLRVSWWNPEIHVRGTAVRDLFAAATVYDWGIADGSGLPIQGTFAEVVLPLLQQDLLDAPQQACGQIYHGPTAGLVQLPEPYQPVPFVSTFRPGQVEGGFDWGAWAIGVERRQGRFTLSFLVHYAYEI